MTADCRIAPRCLACIPRQLDTNQTGVRSTYSMAIGSACRSQPGCLRTGSRRRTIIHRPYKLRHRNWCWNRPRRCVWTGRRDTRELLGQANPARIEYSWGWLYFSQARFKQRGSRGVVRTVEPLTVYRPNPTVSGFSLYYPRYPSDLETTPIPRKNRGIFATTCKRSRYGVRWQRV